MNGRETRRKIYNLHDQIAIMFSPVEELPEFANIMGTSYTQSQALNISYFMIYRTVKFELAIREWNFMPSVGKTWVRFKQFFGRLTES